MKINTKIILTSVLALMLSLQTQAQKFMGIGTDKPNPRSVLELKVEDAANFQQGFLPPKLTTAQRLLFSTVAGMSGGLNGMTVYDTDILAYFVWNGTTWGQLALSAGSQTVVGVGGITVTTTGLVISVDGSNFVDINQLITPADVEGDFTSGFTVLGLNSIPIVGVPSALSPILSFNGTNFVYAALPTSQVTSIVGINGALINGTNATGFTVNGQNFLTTADGLSFVRTVTGINGITAVSLAGGNFQIDGSTFTRTVIGLGGIQVGTIVGGFSIDGSNFVITSIAGINGALVNGSNATGFTINGQNFLTTADGLSFVRTVTGINGITAVSLAGGNFQIDGSAFTKTVIGLGGIQVGTIVGGFSIDGSNFVATSIAGINGALVNGSNATGFTVNGQNFLTTADGLSFVRTITGINGITAVSLAGGNFQIDGSTFTRTVIGLGGIQVGTIVGGFSIDGSNFKATTIVGVSGLTTQGTGSTQSVSGAGMVLASQSLANPIGTSAASYGANPLSRTVIQIPAGVKNIRIVFNAYKLINLGVAAIGIKVGSLATVSTTVTSDDAELFYTSINIDVSANSGTQLLKVFGQADSAATGVMLSGYTVYIVD